MGDQYELHFNSGSFLPVKWSAGDKLTVQLPISLRTEPIKGILLG